MTQRATTMARTSRIQNMSGVVDDGGEWWFVSQENTPIRGNSMTGFRSAVLTCCHATRLHPAGSPGGPAPRGDARGHGAALFGVAHGSAGGGAPGFAAAHRLSAGVAHRPAPPSDRAAPHQRGHS